MEQLKHPVLPNAFALQSQELAFWLQSQSTHTFIDRRQEFFSPEQIQEFEHESSLNGREYNRLADLKSRVSDLCRKGTEEAVTIVIPATVGAKMLETQRRQNDDFIDRGYEEFDVEVYSIPYAEGETMEFFDSEGNHYPQRSRPLSISEKHKYCGFLNINKANVVQHGNDQVDESTGEITGTHN